MFFSPPCYLAIGTLWAPHMPILAPDRTRSQRSASGLHLAALTASGAAREQAWPTAFVETPHATSLVTTRTRRKFFGVARSPSL